MSQHTRVYSHHGETFLIHDDPDEGCFIKITYDKVPDKTGYVGVALANGTKAKPYNFSFDNAHLSKEGFVNHESNPVTLDVAVQVVCMNFIEHTEREEFDPEAACQALHEWAQPWTTKQTKR